MLLVTLSYSIMMNILKNTQYKFRVNAKIAEVELSDSTSPFPLAVQLKELT